MYRRLKCDLVDMTRELASEFAQMTAAPGDRPLKKNIVKMLEQAASAPDTIHPYTWAACYCRETHTRYRINGKHGSHVFAKPEVPIKGVRIAIESYEADTLADVADLYATFDRPESRRSSADLNRSYAGVDEDLKTIPQNFTKSCTAGVAIAKFGTYYLRHTTGPQRSQLALQQHRDFVLFMWRLSEGNRAIFSKAATVAAIFLGYYGTEGVEGDPGLTEEFWTAVRDGAGTDPKSPDRQLRDWLLSHKSANPTRRTKSRLHSVACDEVLDKCMKGWKAWKRNRSATTPVSARTSNPGVAFQSLPVPAEKP